uniref:MAD2L1-binding protein n=1 Tax=Anopheles minimus TaxID=112268 RepID=A0A182WDX2_9DIPT
MKVHHGITIDLETPFITPDCSSRILCTIFELLLYNRMQLPFPYSTFRMMVNKLVTADAEVNSVADMDSKRQREKAQHVVNSVEMVCEMLSKHPVNELMILFGKTIYTAKEAFVITIPSADATHLGRNHQRTLENILRTIGLQLTLCEEFATVQNELGDTNIFVMLKLSAPPERPVSMNVLDDYQLPRKCATYAITLKTADDCVDALPNSCCKQLEVYSDHTDQSLTSTAQQDKQHSPPKTEATANALWFLLDTVVSGYSIKTAKQYKLWQS